MDGVRKATRKKLKESTKEQYDKWTAAAALTPDCQEILDLHIIKGLSIFEISVRLHISERAVTERLILSYKKISSVK